MFQPEHSAWMFQLEHISVMFQLEHFAMMVSITISYARREALILLLVAGVPTYRHLTVDSFELRNACRVAFGQLPQYFERLSHGLSMT
jgi:hypothetical protein